MSTQAPLITAIIPVRLSNGKLYDEVERIERIVKTLPDAYSVLIVDYGTGPERANELRAVASKFDVKFVRAETGNEPFSVGEARDIGTQHATTPLVMYHDIDFLMSRESYLKVITECRLRDMPDNAYSFFALPGAYLTRDFTDRYLSLLEANDGEFADMLVHDGIMRDDGSVFDSKTFAISAIVANRYHLLAIGGHDKSFKGHGAEDFELMHRLTYYYKKGPRTQEYYRNTNDNSIKFYIGFRAYYALYGIELFQRGLVIAHLWHPRRQDGGYLGTSNQARVSEAMEAFDIGLSFLMPMDDETSSEKTLVLVNPGTSPARAIRQIYPALGKYRIVPEKSFETPGSLLDFLDEEGFTQTFFLNPYGNEHRLSLYRAVKSLGKRFIAYDRGAYADSWFFDTAGFLGESKSYLPERWDKPLNEAERCTLDEWLAEMRLSEGTLESNGSRVGPGHMRQRLAVGDRRVLFVALQRPGDTATVHFSGHCQDAEIFNSWVIKLAAAVDPRRYAVVIKKHPLEPNRPDLNGVVFAPDDAHINDLIELADKVVVINSGSGLIALTLGKPVICCGDAFYCHDGVAWQADSEDQLIKLAQSELALDVEKRDRFVKYLTQDFYSFGKASYNERQADGGNRIADRIMFSDIRGVTPKPIVMGRPARGVSVDAPLFYSFGGRSGIKSDGQDNVTMSPQDILKLMKMGADAFSNGDFIAATSAFSKVVQFNQGNSGYMRSLAEAYYRLGDRENALSYLDRAAALSPQSKPIARRKREMRRPAWLNKILGEKPFPIK